MPWDGFVTWNDVARDSFINGLSWGIGFGCLALFMVWGLSAIANLWKHAAGW